MMKADVSFVIYSFPVVQRRMMKGLQWRQLIHFLSFFPDTEGCPRMKHPMTNRFIKRLNDWELMYRSLSILAKWS